MNNDVAILCSFISIIASYGIFSLYPLPRGSENLLNSKIFGRKRVMLLWHYAHIAETPPSKQLREKRHQTVY